jgi:hypothetical protein
MLVLFETQAGYALFKAQDKEVVKDADKLASAFSNAEAAQNL